MRSDIDHTTILSSADESRWNAIYDELPIALQDVHFTYDYNNLYQKNGDGEIRLFVFQKNKQLYYYPFLLRAIIIEGSESEFKDIETVYGYTGPISTTNDHDFLNEADQAFCAYCKSEKIITEFIRFNPLLQNQQLLEGNSAMKLIELRDYISVDLKTIDDSLMTSYSPQNRNKIRKAEKSGVKIVFDKNGEAFSEFESIYLENMTRLNAANMYFFSPDFFTALKKLVIKSGVLLLAKMEEEIIGATVFFKSNMYSHYFLSSVSEAGRKNGVSNLMVHKGLLWAKENNAQMMHLGGGVSADQNDPLLVFKKNFSEKTVKFFIGKRIHDQEVYDKLIKVWDSSHGEKAVKYKSILQRYRLTKEELL